jgi:predicted nuclease of predicted toxin-antitoxin system
VRRVLFDVNVPRPAARFLTSFTVEFADRRGWPELTDGELLTVAEAHGFAVLVTADLNLRYQQNLAGRRIAVVALSTNNWSVVRENAPRIVAAVKRAGEGTYEEVNLPVPNQSVRGPG